MSDGSVIISTDLDNKELEKKLRATTRKIETLEEKLSAQKDARNPLAEKAAAIGAALDDANAKLERMRVTGAQPSAIANQTETIRSLTAQFNVADSTLQSMDGKIKTNTAELDRQKTKAGGLAQQLNEASNGSSRMGEAVNRAGKHMDRFVVRLKSVVRSALVFTVITRALSVFRDWIGKVVKTNAEARESIARLKGALLTLAQPLIEVIIPAFTALVDILAKVITTAAKFVSFLFGTTYDESRKSAEGLYDETEAIDGVGKAAKKAEKSLASFDEINQLSGDADASTSGGDSKETSPDFSGTDSKWLENMMAKVTAWQSTAMLLGGIALVAIGAATGSLLLVVGGLLLLDHAVATGEGNGALDSWVKALGLESVEEFREVAMILGGIALVAIGAAFGNIFAVVAGLALITTGTYKAYKDGNFTKWADKLGIDLAPSKVGSAVKLAGIALIAIGAAFGNVFMILAGGIAIAAGISLTDTKEKSLSSWVKTLNLETVEQWVGAACDLAGIVLIAIGAVFCNILMVLAGLGLIYVANYVADTSEKTFRSWVSALGLEQIATWASLALQLGGTALIVMGAIALNIVTVVAGIALIYAGYALDKGVSENKRWWDELGLSSAEAAAVKGLLIAGAALIAIGAATLSLPLVLAGIALCGVTALAGYALSKLGSAVGVGKVAGNVNSAASTGAGRYSLSASDIPMLASGAVIPPNREFMAVLGDQKNGTNIEAPLATIEQAVENVMSRRGSSGGDTTVILEVDGYQFGKATFKAYNRENRRIGVRLVEV